MRASVKILHGAMDEDDSEEGVVLLGKLDNDSLGMLEVGPYQREIMPFASVNKLIDAYRTGKVPAITLGMRGANYVVRDGVHYLQDTCYVIDGLQRVTAAQRLVLEGGEKMPAVYLTLYFNTTEESERKLFHKLNADRNKLSSNILLRNMKDDYPVVEMLHQMTTADKNFVLYDRITWNQRATRNNVISAHGLCKTIGFLHHRIGPGRSHRLDELVPAIQKTYEKIGKNVFRDNVKTFFDLLDEQFGIKKVAYKEGAPYLRSTFLKVLARVLGEFDVFWRGQRLFVEARLRRKIGQFPVGDPNVAHLCSAGGASADILRRMMIDHINKGKTSKRIGTTTESGDVLVESPQEQEQEAAN